MSPSPLLYVRGSVYRINFPSDDPKRNTIIEKLCLCLQQGSIINHRPSILGALTTTCKNNDKPRTYPWNVYVSPAESHTDYGVLIDLSQLYTIAKSEVLEYVYALDPSTMDKVNQALQFGTGVLNVEDLKRLRPNQ